MRELIMIVEKDPAQLLSTQTCIEKKLHYETVAVQSIEEALRWMISANQRQPDIILIDISPLDPLQYVRDIQEIHVARPQLPILALIPYGDEERAAMALKAGVSGFLTRPMMVEQLNMSLRHLLALKNMYTIVDHLDRRNDAKQRVEDMVGDSQQMQILRQTAKQIAPLKGPVWIEGAAGSGKELFARVLHGESARAGKRFMTVGGNVIDEEIIRTLLQPPSSLNGGTLYVHHAGALNPAAQHALEYYIGETVPDDIRIICASATPPSASVPQHSLFLTLKRRPQFQHVQTPPLDARKEDIRPLAQHFLQSYAAQEHKRIFSLNDDALHYLIDCAWPGNVRQLAKLLRRAVVMSDRDILNADDIRHAQHYEPLRHGGNTLGASLMLDTNGRIKTLRAIEDEAIRFALRYSSGCMTRAARNLGIGRSTLYRRLQEMQSDGHISRANQTMRPIMNVSASDRS